MQTETFIDKSGWLDGIWNEEPDVALWRDSETGLPCLARRGPGGCWCGYVGLPKTHAFAGVNYDDCTIGRDEKGYCEHCMAIVLLDSRATEVNFSGVIKRSHRTSALTLPTDDGGDSLWWVGFDCGHYNDLCPAYSNLYLSTTSPYLHYWTLFEVVGVCEQLAQELHGLSAGLPCR